MTQAPRRSRAPERTSRARHPVLLVARRDFVERARERSFVISTAITLLVLAAVIVLPAVLSSEGPRRLTLAVAPGADEELAATVAERDEGFGLEVRLREVADEAAAEAAVRAGRADGALVEVGLVVLSDPDGDLPQLARIAARDLEIRRGLARNGIAQEEVGELLDPRPLEILTLDPPDPARSGRAAVGTVAILLLYGQVLGYGFSVAFGVVEEKSSRIVELLLATIRPRQLLAGKILGLGMLGLLQLMLLGGVGIGLTLVAGTRDIPQGALGAVFPVLLWFLLAYVLFSAAFAAAASLVSRQEELQNITAPLSLSLAVSLVIGFIAVGDPDSTFAVITSLVPPTAPVVMPARMILGASPLWQTLLSLTVMIVSALLLVRLAARIYEGAVLRVGARTRLKQAWREATE